MFTTYICLYRQVEVNAGMVGVELHIALQTLTCKCTQKEKGGAGQAKKTTGRKKQLHLRFSKTNKIIIREEQIKDSHR